MEAGVGGVDEPPRRGGSRHPLVQCPLFQKRRAGKNALTESPSALSVRASSSPYIGDGNVHYRSVDGLSVRASSSPYIGDEGILYRGADTH